MARPTALDCTHYDTGLLGCPTCGGRSAAVSWRAYLLSAFAYIRELEADADAALRADEAARRACAVEAGIQDEADSACCLADFTDAILELRRERDEALAEVARLRAIIEVECPRYLEQP